jgi:hypothetical protein
MNIDFKSLPQVYYYDPKKYYIDEDEIKDEKNLIKLDQHFAESCKSKLQSTENSEDNSKKKSKNNLKNALIFIHNDKNFIINDIDVHKKMLVNFVR